MRSAAECREQAKECRALAKRFAGDRQEQTLRMAETWEDLAREMDRASQRHASNMLKQVYDKIAHEPVPERFQALLKQLETADSHAMNQH